MIRLEPIAGKPAHLVSGAGSTPVILLFSEVGKQLIVFSVRIDGSDYKTVQLATGESLTDIEGIARLHRGIEHAKTGERIYDELRYNEPTQSDDDEPARPSSYTVTIFLDNRLFDQIVTLSQTIGLPTIDLQFDFQNGTVTYGDAPDGSEVLWNNVPMIWEKIESVTLTHALVGGECQLKG